MVRFDHIEMVKDFVVAPQSRKVGMAFFALLDMHLSIC